MRNSAGLSRRSFLLGATGTGAAIRLALPVFDAMLNPNGTAYASEHAIESRFVLWFNGNGIPERYWIPTETGPGYRLTPCLSPLAPFRNDIHVITGLDNPAARISTTGNEHHRAMSGLFSGTAYTGRGAGGPSFDHVLAGHLGRQSRFRSLQIGVCQESHGDNIHRNLSWSGRDQALPPEMVPRDLFNRIFGVRDAQWIERKKSILDAVRDSAATLESTLGEVDRRRLDEYMSSIRDLERSISELPPEYSAVTEPESEGDMRDWPRIAKIHSDLLVHALASRQTRVASYMLTKAQSLTRFPWLGYTTLRHHDYTHHNPNTPEQQRVLRDIARWHVEEFAYLLAKLKSVREGDGTLLDRCCLMFVHEHAEANEHKNNGLAVILAGHVNKMVTGTHTITNGVIGDLFLATANRIFGVPMKEFPSANRVLTGVVA
jgi:hypothetical protein